MISQQFRFYADERMGTGTWRGRYTKFLAEALYLLVEQCDMSDS